MSEIPWTQAPTQTPLLLSDVWKPLTARDVIQFDLFQSQADEAKLRRRIEYNKLQGDEAFAKAAPEIYNVLFGQGQGQGGQQNALTQPQGQPQGGIQPQAPQGAPTQPSQGQGQSQGQAATTGQPTREQQLKAILDSIPNAQGKIQAMQFMQKTWTDNANNWMELAKPVFLQAIEEGDNTVIQRLRQNATAENNPILNQRLASIGHIEITGKKKVQTTGSFSAEQIKQAIDQLPEGQRPEAKAGKWTIVKEGGKITEVKEEKPAGKGNLANLQAQRDDLESQPPSPEKDRKLKEVNEAIRKSGAPEESNEYKDFISEQMKAGRTKTEALKDWNDLQVKRTGQKTYIGAIERSKAEEEISPPFAKWSPEEKEFMFQRAQLGFTPRFAFGDRKSYTQFYKEQADWANKKGVSGTEFEAGTAEAKALKASLQTQEKSYGMMTGFINNIKAQINRLKDITKDVERFDARLLNVPLVEWRTRVVGTPYENKINMYVTEISTEIGKISTGSQASVRELNVQTREKWEKIHDLHLSIPKMIDVMEETGHAADIRQKGSLDAINETRKRLEKAGGKGEAPSPEEMSSMPDPRDYKGRFLTDTKTKQRYQSDGTAWKVVQ